MQRKTAAQQITDGVIWKQLLVGVLITALGFSAGPAILRLTNTPD